MKVINYKRGYIEKFDCVIHGRITVQGRAELDIIRQLLIAMPIDSSYPWIKREALKSFIKQVHNGASVFHLTTTPTDWIAKNLNLRNYKQGNYMFTIEK